MYTSQDKSGRHGGHCHAVAIAPLDRIVLETDAPYVLPSGFPSTRNDSTAIPMIAEEVARLRGITVEEVAAATT